MPKEKNVLILVTYIRSAVGWNLQLYTLPTLFRSRADSADYRGHTHPVRYREKAVEQLGLALSKVLPGVGLQQWPELHASLAIW